MQPTSCQILRAQSTIINAYLAGSVLHMYIHWQAHVPIVRVE